MDEQNHLKVPFAEAIHATSSNVGDYMLKEKPTLATGRGRPSRPLLGLPLRRVVPQDVHSLLDYSNGLALIASACLSRNQSAAWAGATLGSLLIGTSAITDYRLSLAKLLPIEAHEVADYVGGFAALAAPFALGYHRRSRAATWLQVGVGLSSIVVSLFTNYRAQRGIRLL